MDFLEDSPLGPNALLSLYRSSQNTGQKPVGVREALEYAVTVIGPWVKDRDVYIPFIDENAVEALQQFTVVEQIVGHRDDEKKVVGYETSAISCDDWMSLFNSGEKAARFIRLRLGENIRLGYPMPEGALAFAGRLANGLKDPPAPKKKRTLIHRDTLLSGVAKKISSAYGVPVGANKTRLRSAPAPFCGCVIAAAAMTAHGVPVHFVRADTICRRTDLPVDIASESYAFVPLYVRARPREWNLLAPEAPVEYRADASRKFAAQFERAAEILGASFPISAPEQ